MAMKAALTEASGFAVDNGFAPRQRLRVAMYSTMQLYCTSLSILWAQVRLFGTMASQRSHGKCQASHCIEVQAGSSTAQYAYSNTVLYRTVQNLTATAGLVRTVLRIAHSSTWQL